MAEYIPIVTAAGILQEIPATDTPVVPRLKSTGNIELYDGTTYLGTFGISSGLAYISIVDGGGATITSIVNGDISNRKGLTLGADPDGPIGAQPAIITLWEADSAPTGSAGRVKVYVEDVFGSGARLCIQSAAGSRVVIGGGQIHAVTLSASWLQSTVTTGTAPIFVSSTTVCADLNADLLDGQHGSHYLNPANLSAVVPLTKGGLGFAANGIAKGGLIGGSGAGTAAILPVSTNIEAVLQPDSSQATGLKWRVGSELTLPLPVGYMTGFTFTNNATDSANDIDIYSGQCRDSNANFTNIRLNWSPIVKRLDATWVEGTNQGGLDTGSKAANTWYSIWAIKDISRNYVDCLFSASQYDPTMPSGFGYRRRIGWIRTDASGNIRQFDFRNGWMNWNVPLLDIDTSTLSTTRTHYSLATSIPPLDVEYRTTEFEADMMISGAALRKIYLSNPDMTDYAPSDTAVPLASLRMAVAGQPAGGIVRMIANREPKISARSDGASTVFRVSVRGFRDPRGQYDGFF